jgi:hypothetical protein|tara:strand:+ start:213 stop:410 length:198 start_codon:yes stop_codon:yes gene_type:complete
MIYGWILVMVTISPLGVVEGEALDYFKDPHECHAHGLWEEEVAPAGVGFVCLEDSPPAIIEQDLD